MVVVPATWYRRSADRSRASRRRRGLEQILRAVGVALARLRLGDEIALAVPARRRAADAGLLVEPVRDIGRAAVAVAGPGISVAGADGLRDLACRIVGKGRRQNVGP